MAKIPLFESSFELGNEKLYLQVYSNNDDHNDVYYECTINRDEEIRLQKLDDGTWWDLDLGYTNLSQIIGEIIDDK